jgi:hypothetical protein
VERVSLTLFLKIPLFYFLNGVVKLSFLHLIFEKSTMLLPLGRGPHIIVGGFCEK